MLLAALAAVCWWRARLAYIIDVSHCVLIPDAVVQVLAYELPGTGRRVWDTMVAWAQYRETVRQGQREKTELEHLQDEARYLLEQDDGLVLSSKRQGAARSKTQYDRGNPFAEVLDMWRPGYLLWLSSWHLARLLRMVKAGNLPAEVRVDKATQTVVVSVSIGLSTWSSWFVWH
jgi:hypothetical protein